MRTHTGPGSRSILGRHHGVPRPVYRERDLPDPASGGRWRPRPGQWTATDDRWYQSYDGPDGAALILTAQPAGTASDRPVTVATVYIGAHSVAVTGGGPNQPWTAWWDAGGATYPVRLLPAEGRAFSLEQARNELARLAWP